jgi:hypothetical protein
MGENWIVEMIVIIAVIAVLLGGVAGASIALLFI